jgi:hypothetical protein
VGAFHARHSLRFILELDVTPFAFPPGGAVAAAPSGGGAEAAGASSGAPGAAGAAGSGAPAAAAAAPMPTATPQSDLSAVSLSAMSAAAVGWKSTGSLSVGIRGEAPRLLFRKLSATTERPLHPAIQF